MDGVDNALSALANGVESNGAGYVVDGGRVGLECVS
jgi:hypothetical protein